MTELLQRFTVPSVSNRLVSWVVMLNSTCRGRVRVWKRPELLGVCLKPKVTGPTLTVTVYEKTRQRRVRWKLVVMLWPGEMGNALSSKTQRLSWKPCEWLGMINNRTPMKFKTGFKKKKRPSVITYTSINICFAFTLQVSWAEMLRRHNSVTKLSPR